MTHPTPPPGEPLIRLTLRSVRAEPPVDVRLRIVLKKLLRQYGFRVEKIEEVKPGGGKQEG